MDGPRHIHPMPFGAEVRADGGTSFRLWAPSLPTVLLRIESNGTAAPAEFPMLKSDDGWHRRDLATAGPGTRYRFLLPDGLLVPDPASRHNPDGVHGASEVVAPGQFAWTDAHWCGRPWEDAVLYELHVGTFSPSGDFAGVEARLDYLVDLGVTALEIMPVAACAGRRGWGYDGVLPFAPDASYGTPEAFKRLVDAAHARGLMVLLDVVYNHFGPDGNYLHAYCPEFFNPRHHTPWGAAINFDGDNARTVRDFFVHNALYWIEEFRLDGLRLDAIHAICDDGAPDIVEEIRDAVTQFAAAQNRHVHLVLENDRNQSHYLESQPRQDGTSPSPALPQPRPHRRGDLVRRQTGEGNGLAQWNDDIHHALHVIATGESDGYYADYADDPIAHLGRCLASGFAWQGEPSPFRGGVPRGEPSGHLPPGAFVNFLQTHDQVGNRAFGERIGQLAAPEALAALTALVLLAPQTPLLFMGEEFAAAQPFLYFCDYGHDAGLAQAVTEGRRREFAQFARFADPAVRERIPDPNAVATFATCVLDWSALDRAPHRQMHLLTRHLLHLRRQEITPRIAGIVGNAAVARIGRHALHLRWTCHDGLLELRANLGPQETATAASPAGRLLFATANCGTEALAAVRLPPWSVAWHFTETPTA